MGNTTPIPIPEPTKRALRDLWSHLKIDGNGCWNWTAATHTDGYPEQISLDGRRYKPHRAMYEWLKAEIPPGLSIDHLCSNRLCCNPDHLEAVTFGENRKRAAAKVKFCHKGHPLADPNLYYYNTKSRGRVRRCLTCVRADGTLAPLKS